MKQLYILLIGIALANLGCSQPKENPPKEKEKGTGRFELGTDNSLLWQITKEGTKDTSYVFGTMHMIRKEFFYFPQPLKDLIQAVDMVVLEIGDELNDPTKALALMQLEEGKTFFDYFNKAQTDSILVWAEDKLGTSPTMFKMTFGTMKPIMIVMLASQMEMMKDSESYEKTILELIKEPKIKLVGLETVEDQIGVFDDFTDEEQTKMVMEAIKGDPESEALTEKMMQIYFRQNIDSLHILIREEGETIGSKEKELLTDRNSNWIPKIQKMIVNKRVFIAVGAGHLAGEDGVLELLRKQGYTLTPLKL